MRMLHCIKLLAFVAMLTAPVAGLAMGMLGGGAPSGMVLTDASHVTNPVMIRSLKINGRAYGAAPYLASSDWENPRGGNRTLTDLAASSKDGATLVVQADWVEVYTNRSYSAEVTVLNGKLTIEDRTRPTALVTVVFGPNGHLAVSTDTGPNGTSGQYNGMIVAEACGIRDADIDFRKHLDADVDLEWVYSQETKRASAPRIDSPCSEGGS